MKNISHRRGLENLNLDSYIKIMKNVIKFLLGGFAVWLLIQSLDLTHYLLNMNMQYG